MRLAGPLPSKLTVGQRITVPVTAVFGHHAESDAAHELDGVWIFASLMDSNSRALSNEDPLQGQRADSVHWHVENHGDGFAFASFPNLSVSKPGKYRLRLTAINMKGYITVRTRMSKANIQQNPPRKSASCDHNKPFRSDQCY